MIPFHKVGKNLGDAVALRPTDQTIATNRTTVLIGLSVSFPDYSNQPQHHESAQLRRDRHRGRLDW